MARRTTIGLDIGSSGVRAAELSFGRGGVTLERLGEVPLPEGAVRDGEVVDAEVVAVALRQLWREARFSHRRVVLGVANHRVVVRETEVADLPQRDLRKALPFQVQDVLPMPVDQALLDFHPLDRTTTLAGVPMLRGLLVAVWRDMVTTTVAAVQRAGLQPDAVDLSSFAVLRSMGAGLHAEVTTEALVDIGARITNIVIHTGGVPRFVRILMRGGQDITEALAEHTGSGQAEAEARKRISGLGAATAPSAVAEAVEPSVRAFVDEVRSTLDYYTSAHPAQPVEQLVLSGGGSLLSGLAERLGAVTGLHVEQGSGTHRVRLGRGAPDADQLSALAPVCAVSVGLALGASA